MRLEEARILMTGAAGGIGSATARELGCAGAKLLLTDLHEPALATLAAELSADGVEVETIAANVASRGDCHEIVARAGRARINTLINLAGVNPFGWLDVQDPEEIELVIRINTVAPILLCQGMLPVLASNSPAHVVNVGSAFGAIGYPGFAAYSASKFAVRGFSEALRRELADSRIRVHYVAPRATRTQLVTDRVRAMNEELKIAMDPPQTVARAIAAVLRTERRALARQLPVIRRFAAAADVRTARGREAVRIHEPLQERTR
jgi:short-subunit dehydrogenase